MNTNYKVGDRVFFGRKQGEKTLGVIRKINAQTAKVETLEARGSKYPAGSVWGVPYSLLAPASEAAKPQEKVEPEVARVRDFSKTAGTFAVGDRVWFAGPANKRISGEVIRSNKRTVSVRPDDNRSRYWRVSPSMLHHEGETVVVPEPPKLTEAEILDRLRGVECSLSPENLTCDGELAPSVWRRRAAALNREKRELIAMLGRTPTDQEIWGAA